jgi:hypothetical protein
MLRRCLTVANVKPACNRQPAPPDWNERLLSLIFPYNELNKTELLPLSIVPRTMANDDSVYFQEVDKLEVRRQFIVCCANVTAPDHNIHIILQDWLARGDGVGWGGVWTEEVKGEYEWNGKQQSSL